MTSKESSHNHEEFSRTMRIDIAPSEVSKIEDASLSTRQKRFNAGSVDVGALRHDSGFIKMLESVYDAVFITDPRGRIVDLNSRAADFFLYPRKQIIGGHLVDLISGANDGLVEDIKRNLQTHQFTLIEARCTRRDETSFPAEIAVNRLEFNRMELLSFFVRDITVRKRAQQALEDAVERLQAHDRARSEFVSNVSHDLRTPLTSMIYAVKNMLRGIVGPLPERAVRYLERLESDCRRLLATVNDILDMRHIENRSLVLNKSRIPLARLVEGCVEVLKLQTEEKGVNLRFEASGLSGFAMCDPEKMERVLINVIGNAVKFTPRDGDVDVRVQRDASDATRCLISVIDSGVGIPSDALNKVTLRYFKVGEQPSGSGLGLAIAKDIVELHQGTLKIESPPAGGDHGTAVYICLPLVDPPLVVVADNVGKRSVNLRWDLENRGYRVACVATGEKAIERCITGKSDALVLNLNLPDMEGTQAVLRLKQDKKTNRLPLVALSETPLNPAQKEVMYSFGIPVLPIPWKPAELIQRLGAAFYGKNALGNPNPAKP